MRLYAGIDLHSNNNYLGIMDEKEKKVFKMKIPNELPKILLALEPYRNKLEGIVIESTYN